MNLELSASLKYWLNFFHPLFMWVLLALSLYAAYLGLQVQRTRNAQGDEKKELIKGKYNIRHHQMGSILLGLLVAGAIGGMAVTYINNGKLFVGASPASRTWHDKSNCLFCCLVSLYAERGKLGAYDSYFAKFHPFGTFCLAGNHWHRNCSKNSE